jgi:drug/metabolite transporter (DMT)-like permease
MMDDRKKLFAILLLVSTLLGSFGQLSFKLGVDAEGVYAVVLYIAGGMIAYGVATLIYLYVLGRSHLSWAYGFVGFSYIFTMLLAFFVLGEPIGAGRLAGVLVIAAGTALIGMS